MNTYRFFLISFLGLIFTGLTGFSESHSSSAIKVKKQREERQKKEHHPDKGKVSVKLVMVMFTVIDNIIDKIKVGSYCSEHAPLYKGLGRYLSFLKLFNKEF